MSAQTRNQENVNSDQAAIQAAGDPQLTATESAVACIKEYAHARPEVVTLWAFGIGFVLGWKLKPW